MSIFLNPLGRTPNRKSPEGPTPIGYGCICSYNAHSTAAIYGAGGCGCHCGHGEANKNANFQIAVRK